MKVKPADIARDFGAIALNLLVVWIGCVLTFVTVFSLLPVVAPPEGKDLGYPFAALVIAFIGSLGVSALILKTLPRLTTRKRD